MAVLYGEPGLKDSLMLHKVDTFDDIKLNDSAYIEADVEDFTWIIQLLLFLMACLKRLRMMI